MGKWHVVAAGTLCLFLAGLIFVTSSPREKSSLPEVALREGIAPVQSGLSAATSWIKEAAETIISLPRLREENRLLRQNVAALEAQLFATRVVMIENERLREALDIKELLPSPSVVARVVGRSAEHWFATVTLNRGARHGIREGLPVVDVRGVVGHVESVTPNSARVILLVDPKSAIGGVVLRNGAPVLVEGTGDPTGRRAMAHPLVRDSGLQVGDEVVTSGMSHIFPKGVPIGHIEAVHVHENGLQVQGVLRPYVDFTRLEWVSVLLDPDDEVYWPAPSSSGVTGGVQPQDEREQGLAAP